MRRRHLLHLARDQTVLDVGSLQLRQTDYQHAHAIHDTAACNYNDSETLQSTSSHKISLCCNCNRVIYIVPPTAWLGSRVVSVLDSGAEGPGFKSQPRCCRVTVIGKLFTPID